MPAMRPRATGSASPSTANAPPDLVEVGAVVLRNKPAEHPLDRRCVECQQERNDEHQHDLKQGRQSCEADADRVAELSEQVILQMRVDGFGHAPKVDLEAEDLDRGALQTVDAILSSSGQARGLNLELSDLAHA